LLCQADELSALASAANVDTVVAAIVGAAGLPSTLAAARAGKRILLANKESLVCGGHLVTQAAAESGALLLPVDSEHNALFQCLPKSADQRATQMAGVRTLWLTASGGPFREFSAEQLRTATPTQACAHPNWSMGRKISVDSATLMNKGLEVIEARALFAAEPAQMRVVVHPQSIVHSLVEYTDGSFLAQLSAPDMCTPIAHALAYPERIESGAKALDLLALSALQFEAPDLQRFPCLQLAFDAMRSGAAAQVVLNAANEIAVEAFLNNRLAFTAIASVINECLQRADLHSPDSLNAILELDRMSRHLAAEAASSLAI
jgi:1-deoxy-D-xylulose-5-phosphate reductoisomerase